MSSQSNEPAGATSGGIAKFRGGLRHGRSHLLAINFTWPFATLEIGPRELTLRAPGVHYVFSREGVAIEDFRGLFSPGLRFLHTAPSVPPHVVFWTFQPRAVKASLAAYGYAIAAPAQASPANARPWLPARRGNPLCSPCSRLYHAAPCPRALRSLFRSPCSSSTGQPPGPRR